MGIFSSTGVLDLLDGVLLLLGGLLVLLLKLFDELLEVLLGGGHLLLGGGDLCDQLVLGEGLELLDLGLLVVIAQVLVGGGADGLQVLIGELLHVVVGAAALVVLEVVNVAPLDGGETLNAVLVTDGLAYSLNLKCFQFCLNVKIIAHDKIGNADLSLKRLKLKKNSRNNV